LFILSPTLSCIPYKWQMHFNEKEPPNCGMHDSPFSYAPPDTLAWIYLFHEAKPCAHFMAGTEAFGLLWSKRKKNLATLRTRFWPHFLIVTMW
jgi:hypothetical protein